MWQVIGQDRAVSLLKSSLARGIAHAYLFVGPPHIGKATLALNLAQALNCEGTEPPCRECPSCQKIAQAKHADVQIIGLSSSENSAEAKLRTEISIDQVRQMQHSSSLPPFEGRCRVFIIDGAELLSLEAANCLLKTLEEPLGNTVFILLTTNEKLLPTTVISRCQRLELVPLASPKIEGILNSSWGVEPAKAKLLSRLCHGCLGWAILAVQNSSLLQQREERLDRLLNIINSGYDERFAYASQLAAQFSQKRESVQEVLDLWLDFWRDQLLVKVGGSEIVTNIDRLEALTKVAKASSLTQIEIVIKGIQAAKEQLKLNANAQLVLETLMLSIPGKHRVASPVGGKHE